MTWILGSAIPFGYGALISDVRVSWSNGAHLDGLQKIYPIGAGLIAGFAGSVKVGFAMIAIMRRQYGAEVGELYPVTRMAWHWHRFARWFYARHVPADLKQFGCELIIAGVSPQRHAFGFHSHAVIMRAPEFEMQVVPDSTWGSIGSGTEHVNAAHYGDRDTFMKVWAHGEVGNPGGTALMVAHSVASDLEKRPMLSVSPLLQVGTVRADAHTLKQLVRTHSGAWTIASEIDPPPNELITSWSRFANAAQSASLDASAAVT